jgi:phosphatidylinositol glycan class N
MVVIAYLGWAAYGATTILFPNSPRSFNTTTSAAALIALGLSWTLFVIQKYPLTFHIYAIFPCYFWREVLVTSFGPLLELCRSGKLRGSMKFSLRAVFVIAALQSMVVRIPWFPFIAREEQPPTDLHEQVGYTHRNVWSVGFIAIGFVWPAWHWPEEILGEQPITCLMWIVLCLTTAVFPMLDVNKSESLGLM